MGKRKGRKETQERQISDSEIDENGGGGGKGAGFFACYLLTSICPRFKGHTYIGYTLNPRRRIRQHNGEIGSGAWRTKRKRPWEMVLCIYGFPNNIAALQFEWAWQHPVESLAVRKAASSFKSLSGLANKIKLAYTMLTLPAWQSLNLTLNLFSTKYQTYTSSCPALPKQMRTQICSMDELPCYNLSASENDKWADDDFECSFQESTGAARKIHNPPSYGDGSSEENVDQEINHRGTAGVGLQRDSPPMREGDQGKSFSMINDFPGETSSFLFASSYDVVEDPLIEPLVERSATDLVADEDEPLINSPVIGRREVEIIDVFTPSPCYSIDPGRKKRRPTLGPEIIDLTNSPIYV